MNPGSRREQGYVRVSIPTVPGFGALGIVRLGLWGLGFHSARIPVLPDSRPYTSTLNANRERSRELPYTINIQKP